MSHGHQRRREFSDAQYYKTLYLNGASLPLAHLMVLGAYENELRSRSSYIVFTHVNCSVF